MNVVHPILSLAHKPLPETHIIIIHANKTIITLKIPLTTEYIGMLLSEQFSRFDRPEKKLHTEH